MPSPPGCAGSGGRAALHCWAVGSAPWHVAQRPEGSEAQCGRLSLSRSKGQLGRQQPCQAVRSKSGHYARTCPVFATVSFFLLPHLTLSLSLLDGYLCVCICCVFLPPMLLFFSVSLCLSYFISGGIEVRKAAPRSILRVFGVLSGG